MRRLALALLVAVLPACALAQADELLDRTPAQRSTLVNLAYALGESHALRQACEGGDDQFWRDRMGRLIDTEAPDAAFDKRLKESFNTGFVAGQAEAPRCDAAARKAMARAAARGRELATALARAQVTRTATNPAGDPIAQTAVAPGEPAH